MSAILLATIDDAHYQKVCRQIPKIIMRRWRIAILVSTAIAISYLDRQTLPGDQRRPDGHPDLEYCEGVLDSAFLFTYGFMYLAGGWLVDCLGTRRGFLLIMAFWSLACMSHGFARNLVMLAASRLLLGIGEGGGFPAATRAVAEWFPVRNAPPRWASSTPARRRRGGGSAVDRLGPCISIGSISRPGAGFSF